MCFQVVKLLSDPEIPKSYTLNLPYSGSFTPWAEWGLDYLGIIQKEGQDLWDIVRKVRQVMKSERLAEGHGTLFRGLWKVMEGFQDEWRVSV